MSTFNIVRYDPQLIRALTGSVPAIAAGRVFIVHAVGVPSVLWKVAVMSGSPDGEDDPVGACVGLGGAHTRAVSTALDGAAVDFVLWQEDPRAFLRNAFPSVRIHDMVLQIRTHVATLKIQAEDKGLAIGRGGINVKVASELTGWNIKLLGGPQVSQAS